jgi:molybdate transport system substrate-binding protein
MRTRLSAALAVLLLTMAPAMAEETVLLHAVGSLRAALTEVAKAFEAAGFGKVQAKFGASGLLKDEIAAGAKAEVFASANMEHPLALVAEKRSGSVALFARNRLCVLARPGLEVTTASLLDRMLDLQIKLGTSTPKADPSGDYAWEVFRKAEKFNAGASTALEKKALQLTGGPTSPPAPQGRSIYGELIAQGAADIFLTYCTNALAALRENPAQQIVQLPDALSVGADYGLTVMNGSSAPAYQLVLFILSAEGQRTLAKHGFTAPGLPQ